MLELRITLLSPLCSASGVGLPGFVDREVVFDPEGLPLVPARRLKGLWRDAFNAVADCGVIDLTEGDRDRIFGKAGQQGPGSLQLRDARVAEADRISEWLRGLGTVRPFKREDVIAHHTGIRRQTMIDRQFGRAHENTLRATRVLEPEACPFFLAPVDGLTSRRDRLALALAASAIQQMGSSRHRGWGLVRCELLDDGDPNLMLDALRIVGSEAGQLPGATGVVPATSSATPDTTGADVVQGYWLELRDAVLLPKIGGDPFTVLTHEAIPGSVIQGLLAGRYVAAHGSADRWFDHLFCGGVRFLAANIARVRDLARLFPVPHSVRCYKHQKTWVDLAVQQTEDPAEPLKRQTGWAQLEELWSGADATQKDLEKDLQYHHQRSADRRRQRALGEEAREPEDRGALFTYESLKKSQTFAGVVMGQSGDLAELQGLLPEGSLVQLGRSRQTQYGQAVWHWQGEARPAAEWREVRAPEAATTRRILVTLLSPMIAVNANGHVTPEFPLDELADALNLRVDQLSMGKSFARASVQGAYLSHQQLPRQQTPQIEAGSVFDIELPREFTAAELAAVESRSYGLRTESGFGRIVIQAFPVVEYDEETEEWSEAGLRARFQFKGEEPTSVKPAKRGAAATSLALGILKTQTRSKAISLAVERAMEFTTGWERVSPHLLARLRALMERTDKAGSLEAFAHLFDDLPYGKDKKVLHEYLRSSARDQLRAAVVNLGATPVAYGLGETKLFLGEFLRHSAVDWKRLFEAIADNAFRSSPAWIGEFGENPLRTTFDQEFARLVVKTFLVRYLGVLAQKHRKARQEGDGNGHAAR